MSRSYATNDEDVTEAVLEDVVEAPPVFELDYSVTFNQNRSFELFIGRKTFCFMPYSAVTLTAEEISHPDFIQQAQYFSVKKI